MQINPASARPQVKSYVVYLRAMFDSVRVENPGLNTNQARGRARFAAWTPQVSSSKQQDAAANEVMRVMLDGIIR